MQGPGVSVTGDECRIRKVLEDQDEKRTIFHRGVSRFAPPLQQRFGGQKVGEEVGTSSECAPV
jgi:hypothetical protein